METPVKSSDEIMPLFVRYIESSALVAALLEHDAEALTSSRAKGQRVTSALVDIAWVAATRAPRGVEIPGRATFEKVECGDASNQSPSHRPGWNSLKELREITPCGERQLGLPVSMSSTSSATAATFPSRITSNGVRLSNSSFARWSHFRKSF